MRLFKKLIKDKRGQAMVELALVLPILIILVFGITEFGRIFHSYLLITNASREGARFGIVDPLDTTSIKGRVENVAASLGLSDSQISISYTRPDSTPTSTPKSGDSINVQVGCDVKLITPGVMKMLPDPHLTSTTTMRIE